MKTTFVNEFFRSLLMVGVGGALGSMARFGLTVLIQRFYAQPFPLATFMINIGGCFLIGLLFGLAQRTQWVGASYILLTSGFCGGFTTFSTFALENMTLLQKGQSMTMFFYTLLSVVVGLVLCRVGILITNP